MCKALTFAHAAPQERGTTWPAAAPGHALLIGLVSEQAATAAPPPAIFS